MAEGDAEATRRINGEVLGLLAQEAARLGALLVHYSTNYVFDGSGSKPRQEADATGPSACRHSKLAGEVALADTDAIAFVFRAT